MPEKVSAEVKTHAKPGATPGRKATGPRISGQPGRLVKLIGKESLMKKKSLFTALCIIGLLILPHVSMAKMSVLADDQLSQVVGQAGIALDVMNLGVNMVMGSLTYGDEDGLGGLTQGGFLSFCDVTMVGKIDFLQPMMIDFVTQQTQLGTEVTSMNMHLSDMSIDIDEFTIDAIRLGSEPGTGPSLGSFGIYDMHVDITGDIQISTRP